MIDFHNHILPGVDDGAKTINESIEMLRRAKSQGITDVINTVHFQHPKMENKNTDYDHIVSVRDDLLEQMQKENININIHLGAEVFFNFNLLDILDNPMTTFCNGKYMLIEFQSFMMPDGYEKHLYDLKMSGVTPILAHPERYKPIQDNIQILEQLINSGCLVQVDAGSLIGHFGKKCKMAAEIMIRKHMVHIIGSDAHSSRGNRNFCLLNAIDEIKIYLSKEELQQILSNPFKILKGQSIEPFEIVNIDKFSFLNKIKNIFKV